MKKIVNSLKYLNFYDIVSPFIFIFVLPFSLVFKLYNKIKKRRIWLICEDGYHARDNGYHFYKYMKENINDIECYYVIDKKEKEYQKVKKYNSTIQFKSLKHWIYYLLSELNISNQKHGNPAQPLFYVLHVNLNLFNNRVFLQHGITKDYCEWLIYKNTKFKYFICGAKDEFKYLNEKYGYPNGNLIYTGFSRFDTLHNIKINKKQILIMPTWRMWLGRKTNFMGEKINFTETEYYKVWNSFLQNKKMIEYIEKNNIEVLFYPHINMQNYLKDFNTNSKNIKILDLNADIQKVLKESALLITDYSSVFMDFAYMQKPIIFFQFDEKQYREKHYKEGYFSYKKNGFGRVLTKENLVANEMIKYIENDFEIEKIYKKRMEKFFELRDKKNSERIYQIINKK